MKILVTGVAGFIGMSVAKALLERGDEVVGIDNLNDYYDVQLKHDRLKLIENFDSFTFIKMDISAIFLLPYGFYHDYNSSLKTGGPKKWQTLL